MQWIPIVAPIIPNSAVVSMLYSIFLYPTDNQMGVQIVGWDLYAFKSFVEANVTSTAHFHG